jgi:hypothetical protein
LVEGREVEEGIFSSKGMFFLLTAKATVAALAL